MRVSTRLLQLSALSFLLALPAWSGQSSGNKPANWPRGVADRIPIKDLFAKYKKEELAIKVDRGEERSSLGTCRAGETVDFSAAIGPTASRVYGSVKHGNDGGHLVIEAAWKDEQGEPIAANRRILIKAGC